MAKDNRFAGLRKLREERNDDAPEQQEAEVQEVALEPSVVLESKPVPAQATPQKRRRGRPPGRRSDPDYTQISAYIPLQLLQDVQDELSAERRELGTRTPRPVSQLVEDLLGEWLQQRKSK